jgi:cytosine/adenosine deaminase-related metal-dependent hydrolase
LRLKNGIAPVNAMASKGLNVAMGTDSTALNDDDDMLQEMRLASKLHRQPGLDRPALETHQALRMATANAARPTGFEGRIGVLETGRYADMVLLDWDAMTAPYFEDSGDPGSDAVNAVIYRGKSAHVDTVLINGEVVLRGGRFVKADEEEITGELRRQLSSPIDSDTQATRQMAARLLPYIHQFYDDWRIPADGPHYLYNGQA